jgi:hypothetical protein
MGQQTSKWLCSGDRRGIEADRSYLYCGLNGVASIEGSCGVLEKTPLEVLHSTCDCCWNGEHDLTRAFLVVSRDGIVV